MPFNIPVACVRGCPHPQQHSLPFSVNGKTLLLPPIELIRRRRRTLSAGGLYQMGFINGNGLVSPATAINPRSLITVNCDSVGSGFSCLLLLSVVGSSFVSQISILFGCKLFGGSIFVLCTGSGFGGGLVDWHCHTSDSV